MIKPYVLRAPITVIDQTITQISFREPTGEDLIGLPDMETDKAGFAIALADRLASNVPPGTVRGLPALDALLAGNTVMPALNPTSPLDSSIATSSAPGGGAISAS